MVIGVLLFSPLQRNFFSIFLKPINFLLIRHHKIRIAANTKKQIKEKTRIGQSQYTMKHFLFLLTFSFLCFSFLPFLDSAFFCFFLLISNADFELLFIFVSFDSNWKEFFCKLEEIIWLRQFIKSGCRNKKS